MLAPASVSVAPVDLANAPEPESTPERVPLSVKVPPSREMAFVTVAPLMSRMPAVNLTLPEPSALPLPKVTVPPLSVDPPL